MKKIHLLPNIITAFGLSCGLFVIFKITMVTQEELNLQVLTGVTGILLLAALADLLDGAVARVIKAESDFGGLFDSMADAISFGVGPSVIILKTLSIAPGTELSFFLTTAAMIFSVCGVLRLVRFNLMTHPTKINLSLNEINRKNFIGLPIPAAAAAIVSSNLFLVSEEFRYFFLISDTLRAWILLIQMLVLGYFMISQWKFPSLKGLRLRVHSFQIVLYTVVTAAFIFYGILHHFSLVFFILSWSYLFIAWTLPLVHLISGKKQPPFEETESNCDDLTEF